jgi:ubiquinone/menaquinone biosynthesis C-methylase UbiE
MSSNNNSSSNLYGKHYDDMTDIYPELRTARYYDKEIIKLLPKDTLTVLDVGCANGEFASLVASSRKRVQKVIGIDASSKMIGKANENKTKKTTNESKKTYFYHCSVENIENHESLQGSFDAIVANRILHHCEDMHEIVNKLSRKLTPGGKLIILDLNATGMNAKTRKQQLLLFWYKISILLFEGLLKLRLPTVWKDLKDEEKIYASKEWQKHMHSEPNYHWDNIRKAMKMCDLSPHVKRCNGRFILLVGERKDNHKSSKLCIGILKFILFIVTGIITGIVIGILIQYFWQIDIEKITILNLIKSAISLGHDIIGFVFKNHFFSILCAGAILGAYVSTRLAHYTWRRGPVEDKPNIIVRFAEQLSTTLKLKKIPYTDLWTYYKGKTNCRVVENMGACQEFLKKHFDSVNEGQIWIYHSDLSAFILKDPFEELYKNVVDDKYNIKEVRIILQWETLKKMNPERIELIVGNLKKLKRKYIIKYKEVQLDKIPNISDERTRREFKSYVSDETFIFYTEKDSITQHQTVCISRCSVKPGEDNGDHHRIVITAMRKWDKRKENYKGIDPEPFEKYMNRDIQNIFQQIFSNDDNKFKSLYNGLLEIMDKNNLCSNLLKVFNKTSNLFPRSKNKDGG